MPATAIMSSEKFAPILRAVRPFTMIAPETLWFTVEKAIESVLKNRNSPIIECGVWKGGVGLAIMLAQRLLLGRVVEPIILLDSFEGLPPITGADGAHAEAFMRGEWGAHLDNCRVDITQVEKTIKAFGFGENEFKLVKGWFSDTVPKLALDLKASHRAISMLRVDADWYESTKTCLDHLAPIVAEGAIVIVDDYYCFDGCARAVHDFLSETKRPCRIRTPPTGDGIFFHMSAPGE